MTQDVLVKDWKAEYLNLKEYVAALESTRRDLWGINEELRKKINSLEAGQSELIAKYYEHTGEEFRFTDKPITKPIPGACI